MKLLSRDYISHEKYPLVHRMMRVFNDFQSQSTSSEASYRGKSASDLVEDEREASTGFAPCRVVLQAKARGTQTWYPKRNGNAQK